VQTDPITESELAAISQKMMEKYLKKIYGKKGDVGGSSRAQGIA